MRMTVMKTEKIRYLQVKAIVQSPLLRRGKNGDDAIEALARSIARYGVLQPLLVRKLRRGYELLSGSRRLRAAILLGMKTVPCRVMELPPREAAEIALAENLHCLPMDPYEEGLRAERILKRFTYRHGELAERIGESPSVLAAKLRMRRFSGEERRRMSEFGISSDYSDALLHLRDPSVRLFAIEEIGKNGLSSEQASDLCLSLALTHEEYIPPTRPMPPPPKAYVRRCVVKDVGFFVNSVDRTLDSIRESGIQLESCKEEQGDCISYTIRIPK